jgi:hypothetical protein
MEPDTLDPRVPTPIRVGRTHREKCCVSFAITLPSDVMQKLQIVRNPDEAFDVLPIVHDGKSDEPGCQRGNRPVPVRYGGRLPSISRSQFREKFQKSPRHLL